MGGDDARQVLKVTKDFGDRYAEVSAFWVSESDRYPDGIKYAMQYGNAAGETIVRYDNFLDHPGAAHHHMHLPDGTSRTSKSKACGGCSNGSKQR
ncbi:MAG: DUF6516 family protein [Halobacteriales archaeon]